MAKGADIYSASKRIDDEFPYEPVGVFRLLKEIHRLDARLVPGADYDTAVIIRDLKDSLDVPGLTTRQRQVMALYFFTSSTLEETGAILGMLKQPTEIILKDAVERVAKQMKSRNVLTFKGRSVKPFESRRPLFVWLNAVGSGEIPVYEVPEAAMTDLLMWLDEHGSEKAQEVLRQRREGPPEVMEVYETPEDEYPCLNPRQMRHRHEKEERVPEVLPKFDVAGAKKSAVKDRKTGEWMGSRKKLYIFPR